MSTKPWAIQMRADHAAPITAEVVMERCSRCDGELEEGFMLDKGDNGQSIWASGAPSGSFWRLSAVRSGHRTLPVITLRCTKCGRLESFAHDPVTVS